MQQVRIKTGLSNFELFKNLETLVNNVTIEDVEEIENWWIENTFPEYHLLLKMMIPNNYIKIKEQYYINMCNKIVRYKGNIKAIVLLLSSLNFQNIEYTVDDDYNYNFLLTVPPSKTFNEIEFRRLFYECCFKLLWFTNINIKYKLINIWFDMKDDRNTTIDIKFFNNLKIDIPHKSEKES